MSEHAESTQSKHQSSGERRAVYFKTLYELKEFTKTGKTPEDFVMFDSISILGQFNNYFYFLEHYHSYLYNMIDEKGFAFSVHVHHRQFFEPEILLEKTEGMTDMTTVDSEETGAIILGPLMYRYVEGCLRGIYMNVDGVQVEISLAEDKPKEYPVDENGNYTTFIERMVFDDEEEALEAADEFIAFFCKNR